MNHQWLGFPSCSETKSLHVIGSALALLDTCESNTSSADTLRADLRKLADRCVEACDDLQLIPVVETADASGFLL